MSLKDDLITYLDASYPILLIETRDEIETDRIIKEAVGNRKVFEWNRADGYKVLNGRLLENEVMPLKERLIELLNDSDNELNKNLLVLKDINDYLEDPDIIALLRKICHKIRNGLDTGVIIVSHDVFIPRELEEYMTILKQDVLDLKEIEKIIVNFIKEYNISIDKKLIGKMTVAFRGLSQYDIENLLAAAYAKEGEITENFVSMIKEQKRQLIVKSNILDMIIVDEKAEIGGLQGLQNWLDKKAKVFKNYDSAQKQGVDMPKGVMIAGLPGCGKSLAAKVTALKFDVPLLKLDIGRILGKYVGESENNMRKAIELSEAISPCVLWIDEMEKMFSTESGGANEVSMRLMGTLLTWMQEKKSPVFIVATANNMKKMPPELIRKGRFDEIFFVDLPTTEECKEIIKIHIKKRNEKYWFDVSKRLESGLKEGGFSGADLESAVVSAFEETFINNLDGQKTNFSDILIGNLKEMKNIKKLMGKEKIEEYIKYFTDNKFRNASSGN